MDSERRYLLHDRLVGDGWLIEGIVAASKSSFSEELAALAARISKGEGEKRYLVAMVLPLSLVMEGGLGQGETLEDPTMHALYIKPGENYPKPNEGERSVFCRFIQVKEADCDNILHYHAPRNPQ